tara:strand:+ start:10034 stop:10291 length:258 start_codon:yes stop_codon:yes gene_type:complete
MAIAQVDADKKKVGTLGDRVNDFVCTPIGGVMFMTGNGAPTAGASGDAKAMEKGSLYVDRANGLLYIKTSAAGANVTWTKVGTQS